MNWIVPPRFRGPAEFEIAAPIDPINSGLQGRGVQARGVLTRREHSAECMVRAEGHARRV